MWNKILNKMQKLDFKIRSFATNNENEKFWILENQILRYSTNLFTPKTIDEIILKFWIIERLIFFDNIFKLFDNKIKNFLEKNDKNIIDNLNETNFINIRNEIVHYGIGNSIIEEFNIIIENNEIYFNFLKFEKEDKSELKFSIIDFIKKMENIISKIILKYSNDFFDDFWNDILDEFYYKKTSFNEFMNNWNSSVELKYFLFSNKSEMNLTNKQLKYYLEPLLEKVSGDFSHDQLKLLKILDNYDQTEIFEKWWYENME